MYIDVHCHLTDEEDFASVGGVDSVIKSAISAGIERIICSGYDLDSSIRAKALADAYENVYFCAGFHPSELGKYKEGDLSKIKDLCQSEKCVAVGEIGLDYHFENNPEKAFQKELFIKQLALANELGLPVVLHSRDSAGDTYELLAQNKSLLSAGGLMHCYSYSAEMAERFLSLGLYFSFGGPCTFKNANKVYESVKRIPAHRILSETDCPYLTPVPFRGAFPNEPKYIPHIVKRFSELLEKDEERIKTEIYENAKRLFFKLK